MDARPPSVLPPLPRPPRSHRPSHPPVLDYAAPSMYDMYANDAHSARYACPPPINAHPLAMHPLSHNPYYYAPTPPTSHGLFDAPSAHHGWAQTPSADDDHLNALGAGPAHTRNTGPPGTPHIKVEDDAGEWSATGSRRDRGLGLVAYGDPEPSIERRASSKAKPPFRLLHAGTALGASGKRTFGRPVASRASSSAVLRQTSIPTPPGPTRASSTSAIPTSRASRASKVASSGGAGSPAYLAPDYTLNPAGPASSSTTSFKCPHEGCEKVYKGKHARSIWRRHLQDKHGIPLAQQPRRTRWDNGQRVFPYPVFSHGVAGSDR